MEARMLAALRTLESTAREKQRVAPLLTGQSARPLMRRHDSQPHLGVRTCPAQLMLDRVTHAAGEVLNVPTVLAALVDPERQVLTSSYGLAASIAMVFSHGFRMHVMATGHPLVIGDARQSVLLVRNPVVRDGTVRACVVMPLGTTNGEVVGTLLAMDNEPREWTAQQLDFVERLAILIVSRTELKGDRPSDSTSERSL